MALEVLPSVAEFSGNVALKDGVPSSLLDLAVGENGTPHMLDSSRM
ncbi:MULTISPECIES: hypothetical protein [unclassified Bradyrhizobium]|nr:hypothetical protein [Bradyrhizobium sp. USDA 4541]MCP1854740.1 hypothetical protein [Bradyrhizobium sp. USDA 4541]